MKKIFRYFGYLGDVVKPEGNAFILIIIVLSAISAILLAK